MKKLDKKIVPLIAVFATCYVADATPNIVVINVDDLGWNDVNYLKDVKSPYYTPNIEANGVTPTLLTFLEFML